MKSILKMINDSKIEISRWGGIYKTGNGIPSAINAWDFILSDDDKKLLSKKLISKINNFYGYTQKQIAEFACNWIDDTEDAIVLFKSCYRILNAGQLSKLEPFLPAGYSEKYIKKSPAALIKKYSKIDLNKNAKARAEFIKIIANRPTIMNTNSIKLRITYNDLKSLPTMTRFKFMEILFSEPINAALMGTNNMRSLAHMLNMFGRKKWMTNILVEPINTDQMKDLLFAASMKDNERIRQFFDRYKQFKEKSKGWGDTINLLKSWFVEE